MSECLVCQFDIESTDPQLIAAAKAAPKEGVPLIQRKKDYISQSLKMSPYSTNQHTGESRYSKAALNFNTHLEDRLQKATEEEINTEYKQRAAIEIAEIQESIDDLNDDIAQYEAEIEALNI